MKNKKHVLCFYQVYENDALKNYLEHMAQKGWKLTGFDNFFLHFQACAPHPIQYCVEVMENASPYASNQSPSLIQYRKFCRDAGWDYKGTNGYLHVFSTDDTEAIPVETDSRERYENICRASAGVYRSFLFLFLLLGPLNLYICYQKGTLFNAHGAAVLLFLGATVWSVGDFLLWKHPALPPCHWNPDSCLFRPDLSPSGKICFQQKNQYHDILGCRSCADHSLYGNFLGSCF